MNKLRLFALLLSLNLSAQAQSVIGKWKTLDDETGEAKSIVKIYRRGDAVFGRIVALLKPEDKGKRCKRCKGTDKDKPIEGLVILKNMKKHEEAYLGGTILDAKKGKVYRCKIWLDEDDPDILHVRGYIAFLYRTQRWIRQP